MPLDPFESVRLHHYVLFSHMSHATPLFPFMFTFRHMFIRRLGPNMVHVLVRAQELLSIYT